MGIRGFVITFVALAGWAHAAYAADPLPEGDEGIAALHPGDAGIGADPQVVYADDFESYSDVSDLSDNWDATVHHTEQIRIATEVENVYLGQRALEFTVPQQDNELANSVAKVVSPERDVLFLRYYSKFMPPFDVVGSSHNGSSISAHYYVDGQATPGIPADGTNKFLANLENWRADVRTASPGALNIYIYHPEQRSNFGDHFFPTGTVLPNSSKPFDFGPEFIPRPDIVPQLGEWHCYEFMVLANTPGQRDGRIAFWFEGQLAADFQNLRLRDIETLQIDRFGLSLHIGSNPSGEAKKWYDNVVAASAYIGPLFVDDGSPGTSGSDTGAGGGSSTTTATSIGPASTTAGDVTATDGEGSGGGVSSGGTAASEGMAAEDRNSGCGCTSTGPRTPAYVVGWLLALWFRRPAR